MRKAKNDGWTNTITGMGTSRDKKQYSQITLSNILSQMELSNIWISEGLGKKIISCVADDMTREWITIDNDEESIILDKLDELDTEMKMNIAVKWARLFGGALIFVGVNDGNEILKPININNVKSIDFLKVYDRYEVQINESDFDIDPNSSTFGQMLYYTIIPRNGNMFRVHKDRVLEFKGDPVPNTLSNNSEFYYWGMSVLQPVFEQLQAIGSIYGNVATLIHEFIIGKYKFSNLADLMASGNEDLLRNRMKAIDLSKSVINAVMIDKEEDYTRDTVSFASIPEVIDRFMMYLSGVVNIPVAKLFGRSAGGLNSTGDLDINNYYDMVKSEQKNKLKTPLTKLVNLINALYKNKIENPTIKFVSLYQMNKTDEITQRKLQAEIDQIYINLGVYSPEECGDSRFENGYDFETHIESVDMEFPEVESSLEEEQTTNETTIEEAPEVETNKEVVEDSIITKVKRV